MGCPKPKRIYIVGFDKDAFPKLDLADAISAMFNDLNARRAKTRLGTVLEDNASVDPKYTISDNCLLVINVAALNTKRKGTDSVFQFSAKIVITAIQSVLGITKMVVKY